MLTERRAMIGPPAIAKGGSRGIERRRLPLEMAWQLVGPTAELNLDRYPVWKAIAAAYLEGCDHGIGYMLEQMKPNRDAHQEPGPC